jgi:mono/diheme cytochrome c family protein
MKGAAMFRSGAWRQAVLLTAWLALALLAGCEKAMKNMYDQPKNNPETPSSTFPNGSSARPLTANTVARSGGQLAGAASGRAEILPLPQPAGQPSPVNAQGRPVGQAKPSSTPTNNPYPITAAFLRRGEERFDIYCAPCHSIVGDGDGMVARRGFPHPPPFHTNALRQAPDSHFYDVITHGYGIMYPYAQRVEPKDRWAIVAYIRALQFSQYAPVASLPASDRARLEALR